MTTVEVYMRGIDNGESFALHNGLFGPATTVFHAVLEACRGGSVSGEWSLSHADVRVSGRVLRPMLADIHGLDTPFHQPGDDARLTAFRESITDDAEYAINAIEC